MKASEKIPALNEWDYFRAAEDRFVDATFLFANITPRSDYGRYVQLAFVSGVAAECMFTAYQLKEAKEAGGPEPDLITTHSIGEYKKLLTASSLFEYPNVDKKVEIMIKYWWNDLRYLNYDNYKARLIRLNLVKKVHYGRAVEIKSLDLYGAAEIIVKAGREKWNL
jgi:hypothetical protein